jgi:hypothetical protein
MRKGAWAANRKGYDSRIFMTAGNAIRLNCADKSTYCYQRLSKLKPNTEYQVSFFVRLDKIKKLAASWSGFYVRFDQGNGKVQYFPAYPVQMDGSCPWTGFKFNVRTSPDFNRNKKAYINFALRKAEGTAWIDRISIKEVSK